MTQGVHYNICIHDQGFRYKFLTNKKISANPSSLDEIKAVYKSIMTYLRELETNDGTSPVKSLCGGREFNENICYNPLFYSDAVDEIKVKVCNTLFHQQTGSLYDEFIAEYANANQEDIKKIYTQVAIMRNTIAHNAESAQTNTPRLLTLRKEKTYINLFAFYAVLNYFDKIFISLFHKHKYISGLIFG